MKNSLLLCFAAFAFLGSAARAVPTEDELAKRYDFVAVVTHTSDGRFNRIGKTWGNLNESSTEVKKGVRLLLGLARDRDPDFPFFGDLYFAGWIGTNEIFMRFPADDIKNGRMDGIDDGG